ncbi:MULTISPECIES: hypothetical protein [unclassified Acinetobacter]|uniref:hypothetical protein n=1 Tax=unclassified Acinetobacter TaxID=196816 RepID=UPI0029351965|nr:MULTISPECIES: hypothetical protein [unclassified Acinetobacter]WOE31966.1 hypothetical protein QSG84_01695 [Acinetobacter sp. SAAs470]WOE37434.1 hypothetical protein QSG86_10740 [Acinetobacter sp. SAAs474]
MVDKTEITRPIEIKDNSAERVAFDLMEKISILENHTGENYLKPNTREYFLKLYKQCYRTVSSTNPNILDILKD